MEAIYIYIKYNIISLYFLYIYNGFHLYIYTMASIVFYIYIKYIYFLYIYIYFFNFWLRGVFVAARRAGATLCCGARASHCGGFSCCRALALGAQASVVVARGLSSCGLRV